MCCNGLKAGMLRNKIIIERSGEVSDGMGGTTTSWAAHKTLRAKVKPMSGREAIYAQRIESNISHIIIIRYLADILPSDRINFKGRLMNIEAIINIDEADKFIEIHAIENEAT